MPVIFCRPGIAATVAAALLSLAGGAARAQDAVEQRAADTAPARARAQALLERGNDLFRAGSFAEALRAYSDAHREFPSPKIFFNIARCEESLGHRPQAMESLESFLKQATDADPQVRAEAQRRIGELTQELAAVDASTLPTNAAIAVDGRTAGLTPLERPIWIEPGAHRVSVERAGRPLWVTTIEGSAGTTVALRIPDTVLSGNADPSAGGAPQPPEPAPPANRRWWIWVGVGAGVILAGAVATALVLRSRDCPATKCE